jgi:TP901 family phage tail tape measure protein
MPVLGDSASSVDVVVRNIAEGTGIAQTTAGLQEMSAKAKLSADAANTSFDTFNKGLGTMGASAAKAGKSMSEFVTLPIIGIGAESIKMAANFNQAMMIVHTEGGVSLDMMNQLGDSILKMAPQVGQGPETLANAMYHIASNSKGVLTASQMLDQLRMSAEAASMTGANLDDTTYALSSAMASGVKGTKDAADMMGVLNAIVGTGDMRFQDLNAAIGTGFLATARSFGVDLQSVGAALSTLTDNGQHADAAATHLRMTMSLMAAPSQKAAGVFASLGMTANQMGLDMQKPNGLNVAVQDLANHLTKTFGPDALNQFKSYSSVLKNEGQDAADKFAVSMNGAGAAVSEAFGGGRSSAAILTLLGNITRTQEGFDKINADAGQFSTLWGDQQMTAAQQFKDAKAQMDASLISLGNTVTPAATRFLKELTHDVKDVSDWFHNLNGNQQDFVLKAIAVTAAVGPALLIFGKMASALSSIGGLLSTVSKGMGMIGGAAKGIGAVEGIAGMAGEAGLAGEALAGGGGLLAALGPVGLGIGAVAIAAGGAYLAVQHFNNMGKELSDNIKTNVDPQIKQFQDLATTLGVKIEGTSSKISLMDLANKNLDTSNKMVTAATKQMDGAQANLNATNATAKDRSNDVATAQKAVKDALDKFGTNSPQYQSAVEDLTKKQDALDQSLADGAVKSLDLTIKTGNYRDALGFAGDALSGQRSLQDFLNDSMKGGLGVIAQFGPQALAQTTGIKILQDSISGIVTSWNGAVINIQNQSANVNAILFGTQSTIQRVQGQSDTLNSTLHAANTSAITLQGSVGNIQGSNMNIQGKRASGGPVSAGMLYQVNENGPEMFMPSQNGTIIPADRTKQMMGNGMNIHSPSTTSHQTITIQQVIINTPQAATEFFKNLDQDSILGGRGLTPNRGTY